MVRTPRLTAARSRELNEDLFKVQNYRDYCDLSKKYGIGIIALDLRCKKLGLPILQEELLRRREERERTRQQQEDAYQGLSSVILSRYEVEGPYLIAEESGVSVKRVVRLASKFGVKSSVPIKYGRKERDAPLSCDPTVFDDPLSPEACYFLGLFWADGGIIESGGGSSNKIKLSLTEDEWHLLEAFKSFIKFNGDLIPPQIPNNRDGYKRKSAKVLIFHHRELEERLLSRGIVPRKSLIDPPPISGIHDDLYHHFARGVMDGDGSINYGGKRQDATPRVFWHGSRLAVYDLRDRIVSLTGVSRKEPCIVNKKSKNPHKCWRVGWTAWEDVHYLIWWMNRDGGTYAGRKHDRPIRQLNAYLNGLPYKHLP